MTLGERPPVRHLRHVDTELPNCEEFRNDCDRKDARIDRLGCNIRLAVRDSKANIVNVWPLHEPIEEPVKERIKLLKHAGVRTTKAFDEDFCRIEKGVVHRRAALDEDASSDALAERCGHEAHGVALVENAPATGIGGTGHSPVRYETGTQHGVAVVRYSDLVNRYLSTLSNFGRINTVLSPESLP